MARAERGGEDRGEHEERDVHREGGRGGGCGDPVSVEGNGVDDRDVEALGRPVSEGDGDDDEVQRGDAGEDDLSGRHGSGHRFGRPGRARHGLAPVALPPQIGTMRLAVCGPPVWRCQVRRRVRA